MQPFVIARFGNPTEAHQLRAILESESIAAWIDGEATSVMFSNVGFASKGVRLLVHPRDAEKAAKIITEAQRFYAVVRQDDWFCRECYETVEANFGCCWSCGKPRDEVEHPDIKPSELPTAELPRMRIEEPPTRLGLVDPNNPYSPTLFEAGQLDRDRTVDGRSVEEATETQLNRAFRASVMGGFLPFLFNVYSVFLLLTMPRGEQPWPPRWTRLYVTAWLINLVGLLVWIGAVIVTRVV